MKCVLLPGRSCAPRGGHLLGHCCGSGVRGAWWRGRREAAAPLRERPGEAPRRLRHPPAPPPAPGSVIRHFPPPVGGSVAAGGAVAMVLRTASRSGGGRVWRAGHERPAGRGCRPAALGPSPGPEDAGAAGAAVCLEEPEPEHRYTGSKNVIKKMETDEQTVQKLIQIEEQMKAEIENERPQVKKLELSRRLVLYFTI
ncbi:uncharacterized protein LOC135578422 isoform X2 [Columba livia]|uniref:uncharacterized protein LOC135578422 isoform X2 n=1 Tax=Columba livia TaxID=8932 RepID=UPI0031BB3BA8